MAFAERIAYAERGRDSTIGDHGIRRSSPLESATARSSVQLADGVQLASAVTLLVHVKWADVMAGEEPETLTYSRKKRRSDDERKRRTDLEQKAFQEQTERLLECPCLDVLRGGPCGDSFKDAFKCFILSKQAEKGAECGQEFTSLEVCLWENKEVFQKEQSKNPSEEAKIPKIPAESLKFPPKIVEWSKQEYDPV